MDALLASPPRRLLVSLLLASSAAACGGATVDDAPTDRPAAATAASTPAPATSAPVSASTPATVPAATPVAQTGATPTAKPGGAGADDLLAIAESLAPPEGDESGRNANDGSAGIIWFTPRSLEELQAHYEGLADAGGYRALVDSQAGAIQSWVFAGVSGGSVNASIQVTPAPGVGNRVQVTISPA